jgi:glutamine phosphoribosylpyrophosphate amidotransferase
MCGLVGAILQQPTEQDLELLRRCVLEASVRGRHATGFAWVHKRKIKIERAALPADSFLEKFGSLTQLLNEDGSLYFLAHTRYSTSDLKFNQPLGDEKFAIAHNGVVSQEPKAKWEKLYGYSCDTGNDSELLLQALKHKHSPLEKFPDCSAAVIELHATKQIRAYRNGKRPLYFAFRSNGIVITSTADIGTRAGLKEMVPLSAGQYLLVKSSGAAVIDWTSERISDLQRNVA